MLGVELDRAALLQVPVFLVEEPGLRPARAYSALDKTVMSENPHSTFGCAATSE